jgi:hypothetical protein
MYAYVPRSSVDGAAVSELLINQKPPPIRMIRPTTTHTVFVFICGQYNKANNIGKSSVEKG